MPCVIPKPMFVVGTKVRLKNNIHGYYDVVSTMNNHAGKTAIITSVSSYRQDGYPTYYYYINLDGGRCSWAQECFDEQFYTWDKVIHHLHCALKGFNGLPNDDPEIVALYQTTEQLLSLVEQKAGGVADGV